MKNCKLTTLCLQALSFCLMALFTLGSVATLTASSHREAPLIANDPLADNVDVYAFRSPDDPSTVTLIATYVPLQLPQGGPNYYNFGENVRYEIHIDNDANIPGDEIVYRFTFSQVNEDPTTFFNIRLGAQNLKTTYMMEKSIDGGNTFVTVVANGTVPPPNIGERSIDSGIGLGAPIEDLIQGAITTASSGEKVFAGSTDDPFFVDLGGIFDLGNSPRTNGTPVLDGVACMNVSAIVIQVPIADLLKADAPAEPTSILDPDYVVGVWASASRPQIRTLGSGAETHEGPWVQVSRLGMPLTNEAVIPIGMKDFWNAVSPYAADEATFAEFFYNPELALYMDDDLFGGAVPALGPLRIQRNSLQAFDFGNGNDGLFGLKGSEAVAGTALDDAIFGTLLLPGPGQPRSVDLWPIFHTGVPNFPPYQLATGKNGNPLAAGKPFINNFLPNGGDMLRLNMAVPVTDRNDPNFSALGLVQAAVLGLTDPTYNTTTDLQFIPNMDGFPNGRRLEDDVTRIELQAVSGVVLAAIGLWYDDFTAGDANPVTQDLVDVLTYSTGVDFNDVAFSPSYPYLATPWSGDSGCGGNTFSTRSADLSISIAVDDDTYNIFEEVEYTVVVTNDGPGDADGINVRSTLPEGTVFTASEVSQGQFNLFTGAWKVGALARGASATMTLTVFTLVDNIDITNFVQITNANQNDIDSTPNNDVDNVPDEDDEAAVTISPAPLEELVIDDLSKAPDGSLEFSKVFPVPAKDRVNVRLNSEEDAATQVQVIDATGKIVLNQSLQLVTGFNEFSLDVSGLSTGLYHLVIPEWKGSTLQHKMVIVKK